MYAEQMQQAILAIARGDRALARGILRRLILENPHDEQAWLLLAEAVEQRDQAIDCLERALHINPYDVDARAKLAELKGNIKPDLESKQVQQERQAKVPPFWPDSIREELELEEADFLPAIHTPPSAEAEGIQADAAALPGEEEHLPPASTRIEGPPYPAAQPYALPEKDSGLSKERPHRAPNWPLMIGSLLVALTLVLAYFGPSLAQRDPLEMSTIYRVGDRYLTPPYPPGTPGYPLGSDANGRDLLSRMFWGIRPTLTMVLIVAAVRLGLGTIIGLAAGWSSGRAGRILDSLITAALSIPVIIIALGGIAAVGVDLGIWAFIFGLSITGWVETARVVREQTHAVRGQVYVEAAHALGASNASILFRHVLQQILSLLWMLFAFEISATLMLTAALGFLGYYIGGDVWVSVTDATAAAVSGAPELGQMLATSGVSITRPWGLLVIGAIVFGIVLGFNLLGEGLRRQLSLYGKSGSTRWSRWMANLRFWVDEHIAYPVSELPHTPSFRPALGLLLVSLALIGGIYWGIERFIVPGNSMDQDTSIQIEHLWSSARRDPFGTRWVQAAGPESPEIIWTFEDDTGFVGGPAVAKDGTIYIASQGGLLYALTSEGKSEWQLQLPETPVGAPALSQNGDIYISDQSGGLTAISTAGEQQWHYTDPDSRSATTGPVVTDSGTIFYVMQGAILALNPEGELLWEAHPASPDTAPGEMVQVSPTGDFLFWGEAILDAADGSVLDPEILGRPDQYFIGANGNIYQLQGHDVIRWNGEGLDASSAAIVTWEHNKFTLARTAQDAGAAPDGEIWLMYTGFARGFGFGEDTRIVWLNENGDLLGNAFHPIRNSQVIGVDGDHNVYVCGNLEQGYGDPQCGAFSPDMEDARWTFMLEGSQEAAGGALIPGRLYIASLEGILYAAGLPEITSTPQQAAEEPSEPSPDVADLETSEPTAGETNILIEAGEPVGPTQGDFALIFEDAKGFSGGPAVADDGTIYILARSGAFYSLKPQGELNWEVTLSPVLPVGTPAIGVEGQIYLSDNEGALSAYTSEGELVWRFIPEGDFKATSGPTIGPDGTLYYATLFNKGMIQAVSPDGEGLWGAELQTSSFYNTPEVSPQGDYIFFRNEVFDAATGSRVDFNLDFEVDVFFGGEDGRSYLRADHTIVEWEPAGTGIRLAEERVLLHDDHLGEPNRVGVSPEGVVWLEFNSMIMWYTREGEALGIHSPRDIFLTHTVAIDGDFTVYTCGRRPQNFLLNSKPICLALTAQGHQPTWEVVLGNKLEDFSGSALVPGIVYVATEEGHLYAIGGEQ